MFKKVTLYLLVCMSLFVFVGCTKDTNNEEKENAKESTSKVIIQQLEKMLDKDYKSISNKDLTEITKLRLNTDKKLNEPQDLSVLSKMENLEFLSVNFPIKSASEEILANLANLERLNIEGVNVSKTIDISKITQLKHLSLVNCSVEDLNTLKNLTNLQTLNLDQNNISDLETVKELGNLKELYLNSNKVENIEPISNLENLEVIGLESNKIKELAPLSELSKLERAHLNENPIQDISSLNGKDIRQISLKGTKVSSVETLKTMKKLSSIDIRDTDITAVSELKELPNLRLVVLNKDKVKDWETLAESNKELQVVEKANSL